MGVGVFTVDPANQPMIPSLTEHNVIVDAYLIAPYINPVSNAVNTASYNAWRIPTQMADMFIHEVWYNPSNTTGAYRSSGWISVRLSLGASIAQYNAWLDANHPGTRHMVLVGYEGGYSSGAPDSCSTCSSGVNLGMGGNGFGKHLPILERLYLGRFGLENLRERYYGHCCRTWGCSNTNTQSVIIYYFYRDGLERVRLGAAAARQRRRVRWQG